MKFKINFILFAAVLTFLFGKFLWNNDPHSQFGNAYAQAEKLDEKTEQNREKNDKPALEDEPKAETKVDTENDAKKEKKEKVALPTQTRAVNPETFRMIETIEKKSRELKLREEELRIKELKIKAIEAKVNKDLEKIEKGLSQSKQQLGDQEKKNKKNVEALIKVYSTMKPGEAANLIEAIDDDLALKIVSGMKSKIAGKVLSELDVKVAKRISETLAGKRMSKNKITKEKIMDQTKK
tara:strand:- start:3167 stop:3880 length:714 start_codon:yes stop_codon:yes gene_type:complete